MCLLINQAAPGELTSRHQLSPGTDLPGELAWHHLARRWFCDVVHEVETPLAESRVPHIVSVRETFNFADYE